MKGWLGEGSGGGLDEGDAVALLIDGFVGESRIHGTKLSDALMKELNTSTHRGSTVTPKPPETPPLTKEPVSPLIQMEFEPSLRKEVVISMFTTHANSMKRF